MTLLELFRECFSLSEIRTLCFNLGVDYEDLGNSKTELTTGLIRHFIQRNEIEELKHHLSQLRPKVDWNVPVSIEL